MMLFNNKKIMIFLVAVALFGVISASEDAQQNQQAEKIVWEPVVGPGGFRFLTSKHSENADADRFMLNHIMKLALKGKPRGIAHSVGWRGNRVEYEYEENGIKSVVTWDDPDSRPATTVVGFVSLLDNAPQPFKKLASQVRIQGEESIYFKAGLLTSCRLFIQDKKKKLACSLKKRGS